MPAFLRTPRDSRILSVNTVNNELPKPTSLIVVAAVVMVALLLLCWATGWPKWVFSPNSQEVQDKADTKADVKAASKAAKARAKVDKANRVTDESNNAVVGKMSTFNKQMLDKTNTFRELFGSAKLKYDAGLTKQAQALATYQATKMKAAGETWGHGYINSRDKFVSGLNSRSFGQNLEWSQGSDQDRTADDIINNAWGGECHDCKVGKIAASSGTKYSSPCMPPSSGKMVGHFTQQIWKGTTKIGCATASGDTGTYVVCNYSPRGNVLNYMSNTTKGLPTSAEIKKVCAQSVKK